MNTCEGFLDSDNYYDDVTSCVCHYQGPIWVTVAFKCHITTTITMKNESNLAECSHFFLVMGTFGQVWPSNLLNIPQMLKFLNDWSCLLLLVSLLLTEKKQCSMSQGYNKCKGCQCYWSWQPHLLRTVVESFHLVFNLNFGTIATASPEDLTWIPRSWVETTFSRHSFQICLNLLKSEESRNDFFKRGCTTASLMAAAVSHKVIVSEELKNLCRR